MWNVCVLFVIFAGLLERVVILAPNLSQKETSGFRERPRKTTKHLIAEGGEEEKKNLT